MTERSKRTSRPAGDYPVGYGKPPVEHQFRKGQPRPPRKPKPDQPAPSFEDYLEEELKELMQIRENGVELNVTKGRALAKASISGAIADRNPKRLRGFLRPPRSQEEFDFSDVDLAMVMRALAQALESRQLATPDENGGDRNDDEDGDDVGGEAAQ